MFYIPRFPGGVSECMKIVTVNIPLKDIFRIEELVREGNNALYPSRSEFVRIAVKEQIKKKIEELELKYKRKRIGSITEINSTKTIKIPVDQLDKKEPIRDFKTYKIIKKLEY